MTPDLGEEAPGPTPTHSDWRGRQRGVPRGNRVQPLPAGPCGAQEGWELATDMRGQMLWPPCKGPGGQAAWFTPCSALCPPGPGKYLMSQATVSPCVNGRPTYLVGGHEHQMALSLAQRERLVA